MKQQSQKHNKPFIVDYRNTKYQGQISGYDRVPNGIGTILHIDYLFTIAKWTEGTIDGQCFAVYPQGHLFWGTIRNTLPVGFNSYKISQKKILYSKIVQDGDSTIVIDNIQYKRLSMMKIRPSEMKQIFRQIESRQKEQGRYEIYEEYAKRNNKIKIYQEIIYQRQEDKWDKIEQAFAENINNNTKDPKHFIKYHFNTTVTPKDSRIELIQTQQYIQLRNKQPGIVCRLNQSFQQQNRVKFLGYYDSYQQTCDYYRKFKKGASQQTEQNCEGHIVSYQKDRPNICKENLISYHKKSLQFVNKFIPLTYLTQIQEFYLKIYQMVEGQYSLRDAQAQLEMGASSSPEQQFKRERSVQADQSYRNYQLRQIQNDIYERVNRRKEPTSRLSSISKLKGVPEEPYIRRYDLNLRNETSNHKTSTFSYAQEDMRSKNQKEYLRYTQSPLDNRKMRNLNDSTSGIRRKRYQYYTKDQVNENYAFLCKNQYEEPSVKSNKYEYRQPNIHLRSHYPKIEHTKIDNKYEDAINRGYKDESINSLTKNYREINNELKLSKLSQQKERKDKSRSTSPIGTPVNRSPSRYAYTSNLRASREHKTKKSWR